MSTTDNEQIKPEAITTGMGSSNHVFQIPQKNDSDTHDLGKDNSNISSFVSFSSQVSTPYDTILLAHAQNLRSEVDNIKINMCNIMKTEIDQFAIITPKTIKDCSLLNKLTLGDGLINLLVLSEKVCAAISGRIRPPSEHSSHDNDLSSAVKNTVVDNEILKSIRNNISELKNVKNDDQLKSIQDQLNDLKQCINEIKLPSNTSTPFPLDVPIPTPVLFQFHGEGQIEESQKRVNKSEKCITSHTEEFISNDMSNQLLELVGQYADDFDKNCEKGHGVISFGHSYTYTGSKAAEPLSKDFPPLIDSLVDLIHKDHPESVINQCLINRYDDGESMLPEHADDEEAIVYDSNIYTVSLGDSCEVGFRRIDGTEEEDHIMNGRSLYIMSKSSQLVWRHRIDKAEQRTLRYSITFRYLSNHNDNATIILGDSNTRHLYFGSKKRTFGDKLPGKRVECFTIDKIDPLQCVGYKNIMLHCGINDLKNSKVSVEDCFADLATRVEKICNLCPASKITVSPILPTRSQYLNSRALQFNKILFSYARNVNPRVGTLDFNCFLDEQDMLAPKMCRYNSDDPVHLGSTGIFTLSRLIINKVLLNPTDSRPYNLVASSGLLKNRRVNTHVPK